MIFHAGQLHLNCSVLSGYGMGNPGSNSMENSYNTHKFSLNIIPKNVCPPKPPPMINVKQYMVSIWLAKYCLNFNGRFRRRSVAVDLVYIRTIAAHPCIFIFVPRPVFPCAGVIEKIVKTIWLLWKNNTGKIILVVTCRGYRPRKGFFWLFPLQEEH